MNQQYKSVQVCAGLCKFKSASSVRGDALSRKGTTDCADERTRLNANQWTRVLIKQLVVCSGSYQT